MPDDPEIGQLDHCTRVTTNYQDLTERVHIIYTDGVHGICQEINCQVRRHLTKPCNGQVEVSGCHKATPIPDIPHYRT